MKARTGKINNEGVRNAVITATDHLEMFITSLVDLMPDAEEFDDLWPLEQLVERAGELAVKVHAACGTRITAEEAVALATDNHG